MSLDQAIQAKSVHRLAFEHYLRTGERLTDAQWLARYERKFNPYHDELGRFTSPPGVTVSYGRRGPPGSGSQAVGYPVAARRRVAPAEAQRRPEADNQLPNPTGAAPVLGGKVLVLPDEAAAGFRSDFVRSAVSAETNNADTYFELNKRQAVLDRLRVEAGPTPSVIVKADLDDFQRRIDANRVLLDERSRIADLQQSEILRAGLAPFDIAAGTVNIVSGEGELRDYLSAAGVLPIGAAIRKLDWLENLPRVMDVVAGAPREIIQLGGPHWKVRLLPDYHSHHIPAKMVTPMRHGESPAIAMLPKDHIATKSYGKGPEAVAHRKAQAELIAKGDFKAAQQLDIDDIKQKFPGRYDAAIEQAMRHAQGKGY